MNAGLQTTVLVLAAGGSTRMGRSKALLEYRGNSLLSRAIVNGRRLAAHVHVVVGASYPLVRFRCAASADRWVFNADWQAGMSGSLRLGLLSLPADVAGVYVLLVDQPGLAESFWDDLRIAAAQGRGKEAVAADLNGIAGAPAYIPRSLWPDVMALSGDQGAGKVLRQVGCRRIPAPGALEDVDRPADWQRFRASVGLTFEASE